MSGRMGAIGAIAAKDLRLLLRDKADLFWILGFPIVLALFFGSITGGGGPRAAIPVAIVDEDGSATSRSIAARLRASEALRPRETTLDSARILVRRGDLAGYVALRPGTGASFGFGSDSASGIEIGIDPRRSAEREYLRGLVTAALFQSLQGSFGAGGAGHDQIRDALGRIETDRDLPPETRARRTRLLRTLETFLTALDSAQRAPDTAGGAGAGDSAGAGAPAGTAGGAGGPNVRVVEIAEERAGPRSAFEVTFPSSIAWALIGVCMSFAVSMVQERQTGTFLRLRLAPIGRFTILLGKGLACYLAAVAATSVVLLLGVLALGVRITNPPLLAAAIAASAFCFTGVMMVVSVLGRTTASVSGAGWAILLLMSMTGGGMIPLIAMPSWMQTISNFSLVKYSVIAVEGAVWRGFSWGEALPSLAILVGAGALGAFLGARVLRTDRS